MLKSGEVDNEVELYKNEKQGKKMNKRIIIFILLIFCIGKAGRITADDFEHLIFSSDEMEILNLTINDIMQVILIPNNETILINRNINLSRVNLTTGLCSAQQVNSNNFRERYLQNISEELWQSLHSYNSQRYIFDPKTSFNVQNYRLVNISPNYIGNRRRGEHYPLLSFSRIGFNNDRTEAIFEINYFFPRAGSGFIVHLKKENNIWEIINRRRVWIS